jgi:hypothetical protein
MIFTTYIRTLFQWIKKHHPNFYSIIISIAVLFWVDGFLGLLSYYVVHPNTPLRHFIILSIGLLIIYMNDGTFQELYNVNDDKITSITTMKAGAAQIIN